MNEEQVERVAAALLQAQSYLTGTGADLSPGSDAPLRSTYETVVLDLRLHEILVRLNPDLPADAIADAVRVVTRPPEPTLPQNNRWFHRLLTDGVPVEYRLADGNMRGSRARLIDYDRPQANEFFAVRQLMIKAGEKTRRMDLVVFVNGLPLAVVELKDPVNEQATIWTAYEQLREYHSAIPDLFVYNVAQVISDGIEARIGSLTADRDRFMPWRSIEDFNNPGEPTLEALVRGLFCKTALLEYVRGCVVFEEDLAGRIAKKIAGYHQFRALRAAVTSIVMRKKPNGDGRGGVVWHTQGSGKSFTMLMLAGGLVRHEAMANPTVIVVTDRNDLDNQLFDTFAQGKKLLRQDPEQAENRADLARRLDRAAGGIVFTTIQKFTEGRGEISRRDNIVVIADEAHRSQYGFVDGGARWMREALPAATFVGFTGTPIEHGDRNTPAVFGDYVDIYDILQAVEDHATVKIYYESQLVRLTINDAGAEAAAERLMQNAAAASSAGMEVPQDVAVPFELLVGAGPRIAEVARKIVSHFEKRRSAIEGKAMAVCVSRDAAMDLYDAIVALRPQWHAGEDDAGFVKVIMTGSAAEGERVAGHARTKARREALAARFKDPGSDKPDTDFRLAIVCDMWLTGFDCPPLHTMYLDKPLAGHSLMQAIARVNRVFGEKPGGLVVDFLGLADQLRDALQTYTSAGGRGNAAEIQEQALPIMQREHAALKDFFSALDFSGFLADDPAVRLHAIVMGVDYVLDRDRPDGKARFLRMVAALSSAFALTVPLPETDAVKGDLAYFQGLRAAIRKRLDGNTAAPSRRDTEAAVRQVISGALMSDGVIDLFQAAGLPEPNIGILSEDFLARVAAMGERNLALEALRKLLNDQIRTQERTNLVQSRGFREALEDSLIRYNNRAITTAQVIEELIELARTIRQAAGRGAEQGLAEDELAFYDALADNRSAREVLQDDKLRAIARELADKIRSRATLDWTQREAVRADMRRTVRRLLTKYGYPPDLQEAATQLVLRQAELMAQTAAGT
jgi:type I restriction enzyme R subunit